MKTLSLKLDDIIFEETEQLLEKIKMPRNRYTNEAIQCYNRIQKRKNYFQIIGFRIQTRQR
jgi:predicted transcriptional regulator